MMKNHMNKDIVKFRVGQLTLVSLVLFLAWPIALAQNTFDSDNDGFDDNSDNCTLTFNSDQRYTNGDGFGNLCDPDLNDDEQVNSTDLLIIRQVFFTNDPDADLNGDAAVNFIDLGILKSRFFQAPGPTGTHPSIPNCNCTFSSDCPSGNLCDWGPISFTVEDNCWWRTPMPQGVPGMGCYMEYEGPWGNLCDGYCTVFARGSSIGFERTDVVIASVGIWADALLEPAAAGVGPVDTALARAAQELDYVGNNTAMKIGRHVADLLSMATSLNFYDYFQHYESNPNEPAKFVDIESHDCHINSARLVIKALQFELGQSGSGIEYLMDIEKHCETKILQSQFAPRCKSGPDALECFTGVVAEMAVFLSTPLQASSNPAKTILDGLHSTR